MTAPVHSAITEPKPLLHPEMAAMYRAKVTELASAFQEPESRSEATEALRGLVDAIVLTPDKRGETLQIDLRGNLAAYRSIRANSSEIANAHSTRPDPR